MLKPRGKEKQGSQSLTQVMELGPEDPAELNELFFKYSGPHLHWGDLFAWSVEVCKQTGCNSFSFLNYHTDLTGIMVIMAEIIDVL